MKNEYQKDMDDMDTVSQSENLFSWLSGFSSFLTSKGYDISASASLEIARISASMDDVLDDEVSVSNVDELDTLMSLFYCSSPEQVEKLPIYKKMYIDSYESISKQEELKNEIAKSAAARNEAKDELAQVISSLRDERDKKIEKAIEAIRKSENKKKKQAYNLGLTSEDIAGMDDEDCQTIAHLENGEACMEKELDALDSSLARQMESALWDMNIDVAERLDSAMKAINAAKSNLSSIDDKIRAERKKILDEYESKMGKAEHDSLLKTNEIRSDEQAKQRELDELLRSMDKSERELAAIDKSKQRSLSHRALFLSNGGTTRAADNGHPLNEVLMKNLKNLTDTEKHGIYEAIRRNALSLYTRMTRVVNARHAQHIDIAQTIKNACKTGGVPMEIKRTRPRPSKAKMVLVLDISGSCSSASKMMLHFLHSLQSVFPRGVKVFVFVNTLYDVSDIMSSDNVDEAIQQVLATVPTRGVYSDYYRPLKALWEERASEITKDTMVLFIGDARNNKNPSGENYLKNIARKARKSWWLNTDDVVKWDQGDSIASTYARYMPMIPVQSAGDLVSFLNSVGKRR